MGLRFTSSVASRLRRLGRAALSLSAQALPLLEVLPRRVKWMVLRLLCRFDGGVRRSRVLRAALAADGVELGEHSYGDVFTSGLCPAGVTVGRYVSVGRDVHFLRGNHPLDSISLSPYFYNPQLGVVSSDRDVERSPLLIGDDAWIGSNATILPSCVRIGRGSVIGAGAVVTQDVEDFAVVAGNPARVLRYRLTEEQRSFHRSSGWSQLAPEDALLVLNQFDG